ncbi:MAG TPA: phosphodiester glycosidase family protein [Chthoniobacteraceae bacterium]|nr:phosphodiester glycosidase family protein [Chthoniobacteraceae bacterium]
MSSRFCVRRFRLLLWSWSFVLGLVPGFSASGGWAEPEHFFENERIKRQELAPGVTWIAASGTREGRPLRTQILAVDLREPSLSLRTLLGSRQARAASSEILRHRLASHRHRDPGAFIRQSSSELITLLGEPQADVANGQFFLRSRVSQLRHDNGALAAINATYFDIKATQSPTGLVMSSGMLIREPASNRPSFLYQPGGRATVATPGWKAQVRVGDRRRPLAAVNRPALTGDEVVLYVPPWLRTQGIRSKHLEGETLVELLVEKSGFFPARKPGESSRLLGRVREIRRDQPSTELGKDEFLLAAPKAAAPFFRDAKVGDEVEVRWELLDTPGEWYEWTEIVSAGPILFEGGGWKPREGKKWVPRHPRTAIGIDKTGLQLLLVVVDGRSELSAGMGFNTLGEYLHHLGAHDAINLDGGGSSAMNAIVEGRAQTLNHPSDATERYVPTGLGVFVKGTP